MTLKRLFITVIAIGLILSACAAQAGYYPLRIKDARGKTVTIKSKPVRIVSLAPSNTEILFSLGLKNRIVGVTNFCNYPTDAEKIAKIGDMNASPERIIALKPDLVVAHAFMNDNLIARLEGLGLTVFAVDPKTMNDVMHDIRNLGKITARPRSADKVAGSMEKAVKAVVKSSSKCKGKKVLVAVQSNPLWVAGPGTFVNEMICSLGAQNVAKNAKQGFVKFSRELAVSSNPDVIIVSMQDDVNYFLKSPEWHNTNAVRHKRVYVLNNDLLVRPGPRLVDGMKDLSKLLRY